MSIFVYCSIPKGLFLIIRRYMDETARDCGGEMCGWGGGGDFLFDRDYSFDTREQAGAFQHRVQQQWSDVEFYVS